MTMYAVKIFTFKPIIVEMYNKYIQKCMLVRHVRTYVGLKHLWIEMI